MADTAAIKAAYPQLAYLIDDPEIGPILQQANDDPEAQQKLEGYRNQVREIQGNLGYNLDAGYIDYFANKMYREGLDAKTIQSRIVDEITPLIGATEKSPVLAEIRKASQDWGVVFDTPTLNHWLAELGSGRQTVDNLNQAMRDQMTNMFPQLANQFQQGQTFRQVTDPYKQIIAQTLELAPEQVDFIGDPKWRNVISHVDPTTGQTRLMSSVEAAQYARSQPEWAQTTNFRDRSDGVIRNLQGVFNG